MNYSASSRNSKPWLSNTLKRRSRPFQSNNGREFRSNEFKELCKDSVIKRELSTPYNPQHNGIAERKNIAINIMIQETQTMVVVYSFMKDG